MEKITPEMIELATRDNSIFVPYDDENVLLFKEFTVPDAEVKYYIHNIDKLIEHGVQTPRIKDYQIVKYKPDSKYSKCVILEEKAKGRNIDSHSIYISTKKEVNFEEECAQYISYLDDYINEMVTRSEGSQDFYNKLVTDYIYISSTGLSIDPKPLNFFYDKDAGFTFIDINGGGKDDLENFLPRYILGCVLSYGLPGLIIDYVPHDYIDEERMNKLKTAISTIITKSAVALIPHGYSKEMVLKSANNWIAQLNRFQIIDSMADLPNVIAKEYTKIKNEKPKEQEESDWTIGW